MSESLVPANPAEELLTGERCYITELLNDKRAPAASLARCRVRPGITTELHCLNVDEYYVITDGHGVMELGDDKPFEVHPGNSVVIPAGTPQRIRNNGSKDLVFFCVCLPRFAPDCYRSLE
ncbi:MAG: cupin domain-containing protein [Woeseia sp.]|nr:cupin domain-containing protein [Woeseia sp.]MBT8095646.1 cupin domain-containing protein [Woeseia sp.]NNL55599.1 cupin domain-containing protein [Woeseia sp.]